MGPQWAKLFKNVSRERQPQHEFPHSRNSLTEAVPEGRLAAVVLVRHYHDTPEHAFCQAAFTFF